MRRRPHDDRTLVIRASNGATAVLVHDPGETMAAMHLRVACGSRHDPDGASGSAHAVEHLLYSRDASHRDAEYLRQIQSMGGVINANTSADWTKFFTVIGADLLGFALDLETARFTRPVERFSARALSVECQIIRNERRQRMENVAFGTGVEAVTGVLFPASSHYRRLPIGLPADLNALTAEHCAAHFAALYTGPRVNLTIAGEFERERTAEQALALLDVFGPGPTPDDPVETEPAGPTRRIELASPFGSKVFLGIPLPAETSWDFRLATLASFHLGRGAAARLSGALVDRLGLATGVAVKVMGRAFGASIGVVELVPAAGVSPDTLIAGFDVAMFRIASELSQADLDRAKALYAAGWLSDYDSLLRRNDWLSLFLLHQGSVEPYFTHADAMAATDMEKLRRGVSLWHRPAARAEVVFAA